jgi:hypothetical protein
VAEAAEVLRDYAAARFGVPARERTSEELVAALGPRVEGLALVLGRCDAVKFAAHDPTAEERDAVLRGVRGLVEATS